MIQVQSAIASQVTFGTDLVQRFEQRFEDAQILEALDIFGFNFFCGPTGNAVLHLVTFLRPTTTMNRQLPKNDWQR